MMLGNSRLFLLCLAVSITLASRSELNADNVIRASLAPESESTIGQRIVLRVDVLGKDGWAKPQQVPRMKINGAIVYVPPVQGTRINETINNESYSGTRTEVWVFPQKLGTLQIPPIRWKVANTVFGASTKTEIEELETPQLTINITSPSESWKKGLVTSRLEWEQSWSNENRSLKVGDAIVRKISRTASDVPSLMIEPIQFVEEDGWSLLPRQPESDNRFNRGELTSTRMDSATYQFVELGEYTLPDITISWYDPDSQLIREEVAKGAAFTITATSSTETVAITNPKSGDNSVWAALLYTSLAIGALTALAAVLSFKYRAQFASMWQSYADSESSRFRKLRRATHHAVPNEILRSLYSWARSELTEDMSIRTWLHEFSSEDCVKLFNELERSSLNDESHFASSRQFGRYLREARHKYLKQKRQSHATAALPPLRAVTSKSE